MNYKNKKFLLIFLFLVFAFLFSSCSFKAKTLANDHPLNPDLLKQKATVLGPPADKTPNNKEQSANQQTNNYEIQNPESTVLDNPNASDSSKASDSAKIEKDEQRAKDLALNHVFQMEEYKDGRGENLTANSVTKQDCEGCYNAEVEFNLTDESLSDDEKKVLLKVVLENWQVSSAEIQQEETKED